MNELVGFPLFLIVWNRAQGQDTPALHLQMAGWLEAMWRRGETRLLLQAFRSGGKSTIVGLFAAWLLYRQPDLRILVLAADLMLARKMVRNVKRIVERHPLTLHLRPEQADQWGADRFTITRALELRDPSMLAKGIGANMTGSRADVIICDDVEVPNTCDTAEKRADLRERLAETGFVLVPGGTLLYVGTPHSWYTIYADEPRREIGEETEFLDGFRRLSIPVIDAEGSSAWPERFRREDIERLERASGPARFKSQMLLQPVNIAEGKLDPACFVRYAAEPDYLKEINLLQLGDRKIISASAWWDPSFGSAGGDGSVLAIIYTDEFGHHWLHRLCYLNRAQGGDDDEATRQCRAVALLAREFHLPSVAVEINGLGRFLPGILRRELARAKVGCAVVEISSRRPKDLRIMEAFDAALAARILHVHDSVYGTGFIAEVQEWRPGLKNARDDGLDAVAGALSREPLRIGRLYHSGPAPGWRHGAGAFTAKTEFDVS